MDLIRWIHTLRYKFNLEHEYEIKRAAITGYFGGRRDAINARYGVIDDDARPWLDKHVHNTRSIHYLVKKEDQ